MSRPVLVARLLELDAVGALTTAHVRAGAQVGGVNARTVWRWLETARAEGRVERRPRARLELSEQAWEVLAQAGGNVSVLHRHLKDAGGEVPSLASLYRVGAPGPGGRKSPAGPCGGAAGAGGAADAAGAG
ncbi:hypothetical protein ACFCXS_35540 [Streptomyces sp. NPDC056373]|uniref:hypothetical protein n=1 Tax=Streptomyces sp. NPDC056373 TaxID=3345798 RepID=UPI0035E33D94